MKHTTQIVVLFCLNIYVRSAKLPGPLVYVVTPSSKPLQPDAARASPFYYHNWMRRMDTPDAVTSTTTTAKTPDLIFAEFEAGNNNVKSIRKLLEKEKSQPKSTTTTTTSRPIYVPNEDGDDSESNIGVYQTTTEKLEKTDMTDYFALYNNLHGSGPMFVPSVPLSTVAITPTSTTTTTTTIQTPVNDVQNIWHIIDSQKHNQFSGKWEEETTNDASSETNSQTNENVLNENQTVDEDTIDDNFALPGFTTGNGAENESRAIRTEPNIRFPYINLKPFKMKNFNSKKLNNMFNLDSFTEIKNPVRGEVQETHMVPVQQPVDRYNPAQPYLPTYGTKSKESSRPAAPVASVPASANLVPPPPPPAPQVTADDFPTPRTYESFPPYAPGGPNGGSTFSFPPSASVGMDSSASDDDVEPSGYRYKPSPPATLPAAPAIPSPPVSAFIPTLPPLNKPFSGYSYDKPPIQQEDTPPTMDMDDKPDFQGYHYNKPAIPSYPSQPTPLSQHDYAAPSYGHHDSPPSYQSGPDYPELIYDKPHGMKDMKGGDSGQDNDMGMMPPPIEDTKPDSNGPPMDDHGFPHDFPDSFKYSHDFDDHHYHHHHPPTTSTTEQPRVNRFSYYYLGKKLYYLPLYFSVYFVVYVGALIIKAVLRHKITYPNSFRPNDTTASFFSKRSIDSHLSNDNLHEITGRITKAIATAADKYISEKSKDV
ncbi:unnamed protein product [Arctia plantaginis]|uniref:Uncharacterized protein n=1 Tax=Arctia plantaginis TaxID=874455 RepID=A0A8S1BCA3_ARCPL|nr:unnamed protein product [Arctia plantaginis]